MRSAALCALLAGLVIGCGSITVTPPAPTPADFPGLAAAFARHGVTVGHVVSGDAGCGDQNLIPTAIRFEASGLDQPAATPVYIYIFRNREAFDRLLPAVASCASVYVTDPEGEPWVPVSPFILSGPGPWPPEFRAALTRGLTEAAGTGG